MDSRPIQFSNNFKTAYLVFVITIMLSVILTSLTVTYMLSLQKDDAVMINKSGRQRMLSQSITKQIMYKLIDDSTGINPYDDEKLYTNVEQWKDAQVFLKETNLENDQIEEIDSILNITGNLITVVDNEIQKLKSSSVNVDLQNIAATISQAEIKFLANMEEVTFLLQKKSESKNQFTRNITYILALIAIAVILGEFFLIILPAFKQLRERNAELKDANKQLSDFAQITAHNLRAPIGNLIFLSNFYKEAESDEERQELFEKSDTVVKHLDETIHVLLEGLKIKTKNTVVEETIEIEKVVDITKDLLVGEIMESNATITTNFSAAPIIFYHRIYLESILLNLIGNALKYRDLNREPVIHVHTKKENNQVKLYVEDNGLGIDLKRQGKKIFGLHQTFHRNRNSKGIGLFMTKNQIESLGGTIEVQSIPDKGSTFIVTFKQ